MPGPPPGALPPDRPGSPPPPPAPPGYELLGPLGRGAMGAVWRARSAASGAVVALKWVPAGADATVVARLRHEAEVLASLDHPNVLRVLDLSDVGGALVLVTEHAPGGSLADLLADRGRLPAPEVVGLGLALAGAVGAAHEHRVLHRDVKPANVLFAADGSPLLSDFGTAIVAASRRRTSGCAVVGTAEYLDPAVAAGGAPDVRADLYALGVTLYEALAGHVPHTGPSPEAIFQAASDGSHVRLRRAAPDAAEHVVAAIERAMARDRRARQPDVATFAGELLGAPPAEARSARVQDARVQDGRPRDALPWDPPAARLPPVAAARSETEVLPPLAGATAAPHRPTRTFGPRPPRPTTPAQVLRRAAVVAPLAALVVTAAVLASPLSPIAGEDEEPAPATPTSAPCPAVAPGPGFVTADLDGDGCRSALAWDGAVLEVPEGAGVPAARYAIGRPGDELLFGDWDCDRIVTPAIHRPTTGAVIVYDRWAEPGAPLEGTATEVTPGGTAAVASGADGCDRVVVDR